MYNIDNGVDKITLEDILKRVTEYDIYQYYMGKPFKVGKIMCSPLRIDKQPSFGIFKSSKGGNLLWKDQATGETGNVISFVAKKENIQNIDALKKIWEDVLTEKIISSCVGKYIQDMYKNVRTTISITRKNFTKTDDEYWGQYYIDRDLLKKHLVSPIQTFWVNDIKSNIVYTKEKPLYAYEVYDKFQIYNPYGEKEDKFRTNCGPYDLYGYEQLPWTGKTLIITKSKKDVMVLDRLGYNAVAPTGESSIIPERLLKQLKDRFEDIYIFYDNDEPGIKGAEKLSEKTGFKYIYVPIEYYKKFGIKDISDFIKAYKVTKSKDLIKTLINSTKIEKDMEDFIYDEILRSLEITNEKLKKGKLKKGEIENITENELLETEESYEEQESS